MQMKPVNYTLLGHRLQANKELQGQPGAYLGEILLFLLTNYKLIKSTLPLEIKCLYTRQNKAST